MSVLWIDCETYNEADLKVVGTARYAETAEPIIITWAEDDGPVEHWDVLHHHATASLSAAVERASILRAAFAQFDRLVLSRHALVPYDPAMWECLTARAYRAGWPRGGLDYLSEQLGLGELAKETDGKRLIRLFCQPPRVRAPADWRRFLRYARQDVVALRECWHRLPGLNDSAFERETWVLDQQINDRGLPLDPRTVIGALDILADEKRRLNRLVEKLTAGEAKRTTDLNGIKRAMAAHGCKTARLDAATVQSLLDDPATPAPVKQLAQLRQDGSRATNGKWTAMLAAAGDDHRIRHMYQYGGAARTLRWAGRIVQPHNLIRPPSGVDSREVAQALADGIDAEQLIGRFDRQPLELLAYAIRGAFSAPEGKHFCVGDLSQIEARKVHWLAGHGRMLDVFRAGEDPYVYTASQIGSSSRQLGKVLTLACGYGMSARKFRTVANAPPYSLGLSETEAEDAVRAWRQANSAVVDYWYSLGRACVLAISSGQPQSCLRHEIRYYEHHDIKYLAVSLPSGRWLNYPGAHLDDDGELQYRGMRGIERTYGAKLVENMTQASSRDVLAHGMMLARHYFEIIGHVHDEVIAEVPDGDDVRTPRLLEWCLTQVPAWAEKLPLAAECVDTRRYAKL